ncbi:YfiT family bacillithiol transferase [Aquibacillus rhizosphaerae]|uniref:Metal-dependent hydrolase n=1 Tax=Aquibacillus rhizosphaerae TaxID=3051431 RepID=A0ABT7L5Q1_9BACI|nr:putative metal-dependent hydrolase [Aquibacillus sp. LR5S19]MDL4839905.1 putative metal-dependent hydrolase [Aquibacillus sp. LR5S19]
MHDHIRFPIGQFEPVQNSTPEQRNQWILNISELPEHIRNTVQNLSIEQLHTQYRSGGWTIQQVVHHMADNDMNAFIRFKKALTENNPISSSYREDLWAELSDYQNTPIEISLNLIESIHSRFVILLRSLSEFEFQRSFKSPTHGFMNLEIATQRYAWHGKHHIAQIESLKQRMGW